MIVGMKRKGTQFLYWFTHTELLPVSPYPKVESTKKQYQLLTDTAVLEHYKNNTINAEKNLFQHTLHSKKPYQGVTNTYTWKEDARTQNQ